jgi:hypothetical protein
MNKIMNKNIAYFAVKVAIILKLQRWNVFEKDIYLD